MAKPKKSEAPAAGKGAAEEKPAAAAAKSGGDSSAPETPAAAGDAKSEAKAASSPQKSQELLALWTVLTRTRPWRSLALCPVEKGSSALNTAKAITEAANQMRSTPVQILNAEGVEPREVEQRIRELRNLVERNEIVMLVLDPVISNPAAIPLAAAADAAVLCVPLMRTGFAPARKTVELVGKDRFLGTITLKAGNTA